MCRQQLIFVLAATWVGLLTNVDAQSILVAARGKTATTRPVHTSVSYAPSGLADTAPCIELRFLRRMADGTTWPVLIERMNGFQLIRADEKWMSAYSPGSTALIFAIGNEQTGEQLVEGKKYYLRGLPLSPEFTVTRPEKGRTRVVDLIVDDDTLLPLNVQKPPVNLITGKISKAQAAGWRVTIEEIVLVFHTAGGAHTRSRPAKDGTFQSQDLGDAASELLVMSKDQVPLAYYRRAKVGNLDIPAGADYVAGADELKKVKLTKDQVGNMVPAGAIVSLHWDAESQLPLAWSAWEPAADELTIMAPPGKWFVKYVKPEGTKVKLIPVGTVDAEGATPSFVPLADRPRLD